MDNATRRALLQRHRQSGFPGSIMDVFRAYEQGVDLVGQYMQQQMQPPPVQVARTPEEQRQGLRPAHQAGNVNQSMAFPNIAPNTPFNTVGMKAPINIDKYDEQGHLVESYKSVPPGVRNLPTGPHRGTVIETPANMQSGGRRLKKDALEMFPALEALGDVKVKTSKRFTKEKTGIGDIEYFAPGQEQVTYPTGEVFKHPGSDKKHAVLVNPDTNNAQSVALDLLHGLSSVDPEYKSMVEAFGNSLDEEEIKYWYDQDVESGLAMDGYDQFRQNYVDGKIRNLLFEGTPEDFKQARYNPDEKTYIQLTNPDAFEQFQRIEQHLKGHRKYQSAGEVKPYRATSKEDYRYRQRMYDDSLNHHLATLKQIELMGQKEDFRGFGPQVADKPSDYQQPWTLDHLKKRTAEGRNWSSLEEAMDDGYPFFDELDEELYKYYINDLGFSKDVIGLTGSPDVFSSTIEPSYSYYDGYAQSPYYPAPKQPIAPFNEIQRLKPLGLSGSTVQPLAERDIIRNTRELPKPGKQPELIMRTNQGMRTGQEPNYYKVWDDKGKQWSTRPVEPEELDRYRRKNKRVEPIVTPPISFKDGGPRKFQGAGSVTKDKVNWYDTIDFRKWGLQDYGDSGTFNSAFKDARESGADEFVWKDNRYTTKLASKKTDDLYEDSKEFISRYINKADYPTGLPPYMDMFQWRDFVADSVGNDNSNAYYDAYFKPEDTSKVPLTPHRKKYLAEEGRKAAAKNIDDPFYFSITEQKGDLKEEGHVDKSRATQVYTMGLPRMFIYNDPNQKGLGTTAVHELAHKNLQSGEKLWDPEQRGVPSQKKLIDNIKEIGTQYYDGINTVEDFQYLTRPSEVEARKISTLYYLEKEKGKDIFKTKVTRDDLAKMRDDENLPYDIGQLLEIFKFHETELLDYLNNHIAEQKKRGGPRKFQNGSFADRNYLPPIAQAIEKAGGFDQYQANFAQAETLRDLNSRPTISQGTFDVDEAGNIVEDNPSFLEMAANPMATARTSLDPSVEGRPSRVEFDQAKARGNMAGQIANDMVNPAAWVNYGVNAVRDLSQGNFVGAGLNALGAIPGIPGAVGVGRTAIKYGRNPYLLNANRANKYDFHSIGDKPHFWRGYETPITDPSKLSPSSNFGGYLDDLRTAERLAERPVAQQGREESRALFGEFPAGKEANDFAGTVFKRMDEAASDARTAFNQRHAPFLGDEIGRGAYGRVSQFKNNPDYVFKIGRSEGANAKPNFLRALEPFQNRSNIATPLQKANFPLKDPHFGIRQGTGEALVMRNLNSPTFGTQQFAGLNARQAKALQIKTARQLRDAGIGLDFAADAGNLASSNVSPNLTNFFDLHYRPGLQHDSRYLANQYLRKKLGGPRRYQSAGGLEFGQTGPDFETYGPGLRIDGETYQASRNTGATRIPTFSDGTQRPILLGAAEVYNEPINSVPDGHTPETKALAEEGARGVAERRNQAAGMGLAAVGDFFSAAQRYGVSAPLALAMGKTPNLSPTPLLDRAVGAESPNAFPSEILGIQNPYGATATDILTDPMAALSLAALGRQGTKAGQNYLLKRQLKKEMGSGAASLDPNKLKFEQAIKRSGELNNPRIYTIEDQLAFQDAAVASDVGISDAFGAVGKEFYSPDAKKLYNMTPGVVRGAVDETLGLYGGKQAANVSADLAAQNQDRIRSVVSGLYSNADDAAVNAANQELRLQHMSASSVLDPNSAQLPFRPVSNSSNAGEDIADRYLSTLRVRAKNPPNVSLETRDDNVLGVYRDIGKELKVATPSPLQADMNKFLFGAQSTARHEAGHHVVTHMTPLQVEELNKKLISPITRDAQYTGMPHNDYLLSSRGSEIQARALESRAHFMNNSNMPGTDLYSLKGIEDAMNKVGNDPAFAKEFLQEAKRLPGSQTNEIFDVMKVTGDDITDALNYLDIMKYATGITGVGYGMSQAAGNTQYKKGGGPRKLQSAGERRVRTMGMPGIVDVIREMPEDDPAKFADTAGTLFNLEWNNSPMAQQMLTDSYMRSNRASDKGNIFYALDLWGGGDLLNRYIAKDQTKQRTNERNKNVLSTSYDPVSTEDEFLTMLGRDDTSIRAFFRPSTSSTSYNPYYSGKLTDKLLGTGVHERSHASDRSVFPSADVDMMQGFRSSDERGGEVEWTTDAYREYVQKPTETRARIMDIRRDLYNRGIDVFNSPVTKEQFDNYLKDTGKNNYPYGELNTGYSKDAIFKMLNTIAYEGDNNVPQNVAKRGGKRHMRKYFKLRK